MSEMIRVGMADYKLCAPPDKISDVRTWFVYGGRNL